MGIICYSIVYLSKQAFLHGENGREALGLLGSLFGCSGVTRGQREHKGSLRDIRKKASHQHPHKNPGNLPP